MKPKTKIYVYGRRVNGRFDSFKASLSRGVRVVGRYTLTGGVLYGVFMIGAFTYSTSSTEAMMIDTMPQKVAELKADVVERLAGCESGGFKETDGIIIFDSNKRASIGQLQFQTKTVQHYYKTLYQQEITPKEATLVALDYEKASALATDVIFKADGIDNWYNCAKKLGLKAEIKIINKLN